MGASPRPELTPLALFEPGRVVVRGHDSPAEAEDNFEVLCEEG